MNRLTLAFLALLSACAGEPPLNIGNQDGRLAACPESPNCVSSYDTNDSHYIEPIKANLAAIETALLGMGRTNIVRADANYLYAEFTSRLMGFVDDVEFLYDSTAGKTNVRSASRLGYGDMGVNRKRIETLREAVANQHLIK